jgi:hypothetical protein
MDDGGGEQEFYLSRQQCLTEFDGGWVFDSGQRSTTAAAGCDRGRGRLTAAMEDGDGRRGG